MRTTYKINITTRAQQDTENIFVYLERERRFAATKFFQQFEKHASGLRWAPARYPKIRERFRNRRTYRHIPFLRYRLVYRIQRRVVIILRVVHQSQLLREVE